jgi:hypothetical protein
MQTKIFIKIQPHFSKRGKMETDLVPKFSDKYESALSLINAGNLSGAKLTYRELSSIYSEINASNLEQVHKQLAYNCLVDVYNKLQESRGESPTSKLTTGFIITAVILAILAVVLILKPSIVGLTAADFSNHAPVWTGDNTFKVSSLQGSLEIDLNKYFSDADWDELTYIATRTENLDVTVIGNILTLIPKIGYEGTEQITIIASDMEAIAKVPASVVIG